ncbi:zinc finger protein 37-like isoform X2 [Dunckerocampus dactyliophorus]|uniref:zinc finger protein 37-like isoform X2 n=1 Tax=Dunckerocampus dactyliophorus TaxID=161453 RepID=UPI0024058569|nr:zinc finger protein 37-like isoform X2 [Dunckerocampus dactyliophorus]
MNHCYANMATSSQREGGRESDPPTPSKQKKPQTAANDVQQLIGHQEECHPQLQGRSFTLKREDPHPPNVKEEKVEFCTMQEGECLLRPKGADLTKLPLTGVSVQTEDREGEPPESLRSFSPANFQQMIGCQEECLPQLQERSSTLKQEEPQPPHIKKEEEELWTTQEGECLLRPKGADLTTLPLTVVSMKTEGHEDKAPEFSQLHRSPRGAEPPSSSSPQHMTTEANGNHCGGSQTDNLLAPLSDSDDTQRALNSDTDCEGDMRTLTDNKHSEKKKTGKKRLTCSVCPKSFCYKYELTLHMRKHTGEKPFACSVCGQRFSYQSNIVPHMRIHTGEKPFCCTVCCKRFIHKAAMVSHMRRHTGE